MLSIAFAAPGITSEWNISKSTLGVALSFELVGMAFGSITIGGVPLAIVVRLQIHASIQVTT